MTRWDVIVVGAGTAGGAAALCCARQGLRTLLLERGPLDEAGARWVNGVPGWSFDEAGVERPQGSELVGKGAPMHLVGGKGRVVVEHHDVLEVDMVRLVARLQAGAQQAGAELRGGVGVRSAQERAGHVVLHTAQGDFEGRYVIDAAGLSGPRLLGQREARRGDLCAAAQEVRVLQDPTGAARFFEGHGVPLGSTLSQTGVAGGFSIRNVRVHENRVFLLTGSIPALGHPGGAKILADFVAEHAWIGTRLWGGARAVPLAAPEGPLGRGRLAAVGDSAAQVFAAHGSGIGIGMVAARMLAGALADGGGPAAYDRAWRRRFLGLYRGYDRFRRYVCTLDGAEVGALVDSGLLSPELARAGLDQQQPPLAARTVIRLVRSAARNPAVAAKLLPVVARMQVDRLAARLR